MPKGEITLTREEAEKLKIVCGFALIYPSPEIHEVIDILNEKLAFAEADGEKVCEECGGNGYETWIDPDTGKRMSTMPPEPCLECSGSGKVKA